MQGSWVWDYVNYNIKRVLAWKIIQGYVDISTQAMKISSAANTCFLLPPCDQHVAITVGYVVWDDTISQWIRSDKAINHVKRRKAAQSGLR